MMIGRRLEDYFPAHVGADAGDELLRVEHLSSPGSFTDVSFAVTNGRGRRVRRARWCRPLRGGPGDLRSRSAATGDVLVRGRRDERRSPADAIALGIGLVPEDRKRQGLVLSMSVLENANAVDPPDARAARVHRWRGRAREGQAVLSAAERPRRTARRAGRGAVGRQPAEDRAHQVAGGGVSAADLRRADAWRGRRREGRDPRPDRRAGEPRCSCAAHLQRAARSPQPLNPLLIFREGRIVGELPARPRPRTPS